MDAAEKKRGLSSKVKHVWNRLFNSPGQSRPPTLTSISGDFSCAIGGEHTWGQLCKPRFYP
ncbi:hypothetical protein AG1IA_10311 [Rhizoctonia solani AG-1 IA]|uniref:Uncharacterized protein n=1 Tax=Thanatephorus cucumeris (strain AG1-IA) TaxID=983506 RepID=L8WGZ4_THACA|nr:hypothetical protein AG1IA_10311 [Rhizoctonia solani AG-1 IA]